jgi:hypothetical protein
MPLHDSGQSHGGGKKFSFFQNVQTGPGAHTDTISKGTFGNLPEKSKRRGLKLNSPPCSDQVKLRAQPIHVPQYLGA